MAEAGMVVFVVMLGLGIGLWTHTLAKNQRWMFAVGVLAVCCAIGLTFYGMANAANNLDGLIWAFIALIGGLPASVGAALGIATGAWAGRKA